MEGVSVFVTVQLPDELYQKLGFKDHGKEFRKDL